MKQTRRDPVESARRIVLDCLRRERGGTVEPREADPAPGFGLDDGWSRFTVLAVSALLAAVVGLAIWFVSVQ